MNNAFKYSLFKIFLFSILFITQSFQLYSTQSDTATTKEKYLKRKMDQLEERYPEIENHMKKMLLNFENNVSDFNEKFKNINTDSFSEKMQKKADELISLISKFDLENEKDISFNTFNNNNNRNSKTSLTKELYEQLKKNQGISIKQIIKSPFLRKLAIYFTLAEISRISKNTFLGERNIVSLKLFAKSIRDSRSYKIISKERIGAYDFLKTFNFLTNFITKPLITSTSFISRGILELIKYGYQETKKEDPTKIPTFIKYYSYFMNSYFYILIKEILIVAFTIKKLDTYTYKKCWTNFIKNNRDDFLNILKQYKSIKIKYKKRTKTNEEQFNEIEEQLKNFISKGHDISFNFWSRHKNAFTMNIELLVDLIINSPTYFIASKKTFNISKLFFRI